MRRLKVLITNHALAERTGSELYVLELATGLLELGHRPVAYSPVLGDLADELRRATVPVVDDLDRLAEPPDLIHGQHHLETMSALLRFPDVPAVFFCHGWLPWEELPPRFPRVRRYVAVDEVCRDRLVSESGIPPECVEVVPNFIDLRRFLPRDALPPQPRRALLFSNYATEQNYLPAIRRACAEAGLTLDVAGAGVGNVVSTPEDLLPDYDVVFAKGRCALEALATGLAVVLCDASGLGPLVTAAELDGLRARNFGVRCLRRPVTVEALLAEMRRYDPADAAEVSRHVRTVAGHDEALRRIVQVYEETLRADAEAGPTDLGDESRAAAAYLRSVAPGVRRHAVRELACEYERVSREAVAWCNAAADERAAHELLRAENTRLRDALVRVEHEADELRHRLTEVADSAAMRLRAWALRVPLVGRLGRFVLRRRQARLAEVCAE